MNEKEKRRAVRIEREAAAFAENLATPRPGGVAAPSAYESVEKRGLEISDVLYVDPRALSPNPLNDYPPLAEDELAELAADMDEKGVLIPLLARTDLVLICGHNRLAAALRLGLDRVPLQQVLSPLSPALEREIMKSENDRRRGGAWSRQKKLEFIQREFAGEIERDRRGGDRKSADRRDQKFTEPLIAAPLAKLIEKKSRGRIPEGTAKRLLAEVRRKSGKAAAPEKPSPAARSALGRHPELVRFEGAGRRLVQAARSAGPAFLREAIWKVEALRKELRGLRKKNE